MNVIIIECSCLSRFVAEVLHVIVVIVSYVLI